VSRKARIKEKVENLPWNKKNPKKKSKKLTAAEKVKAKKAAKKKGRRYPNLVDNMNAAKKSKKRKSMSDEDYFEV
jgi:hypothetical protein